jgi:hypothetical protein
MLRCGDQAALDRIIVHVFQLLKHHLVAHDRLRMRSLLPDLILAFGLVWRAAVTKFAEEPGAARGKFE